MSTLFFLHLPGCEACAAQKPIVTRFEKKNAERCRVVHFDLMARDCLRELDVQPPQSTPSFLLVDDEGNRRTLTAKKIVRITSPNGVWDGDPYLSLAELEAWVYGGNTDETA